MLQRWPPLALGFDVVVLEREADSLAGRVAVKLIVGGYTDEAALAELAAATGLVTYEFENVPAASVAWLAERGIEVAPGARALAVAQDRFEEKSFLNAHGAPTVVSRLPARRRKLSGELRSRPSAFRRWRRPAAKATTARASAGWSTPPTPRRPSRPWAARR